MKKILMLGLAIMILSYCSSFLLADDTMTLNQFNNDPTTENFNKLSPTDQQVYVSQLTFTGDTDLQIATEYFSSSTNVNVNKLTFGKFMKHQGVNLVIEEGHGITDYDQNGALTGANGNINDIYLLVNTNIQIKVDHDGNIILIDSKKKEWEFKGDLKVSEKGNQPLLELNQGTIAGKNVEDGQFVISDGKLTGSASSFGGLKFSGSSPFNFDLDKNQLTLVNANVESISPETDLTIYGKNVILPKVDKINEGTLIFKNGRAVKVGSNSDVIVGGFNHIIKSEKGLNLLYAESPELTQLKQNEEAELVAVSDKYFGKNGPSISVKDIEELVISKREEIDILLTQNLGVLDEISRIQETLFEPQEVASLEGGGKLTKGLGELILQQEELQQKIETAETALKSTTDKYLPFLIDRAEIQKKYQQERDKAYNQNVISQLKPTGENYFIYGNRRIWLGGEGFISKTEDNNDIFPEFKKENFHGLTKTSLGQLEFRPQGGEMDLEKVSRDGQPLALYTKMNGQGQINNGKWEFSTDGTEIYGKTVIDDPTGVENLVSSDMRFEYLTSSEEKKVYDLDVDSTYSLPLTLEEERGLLDEKGKIETELSQLIKRVGETNIKEFKETDDEITSLIGGPREPETLLYWQGQLARALKNPKSSKSEQENIVSNIKDNIQKVQTKVNTLLQKKTNLIGKNEGGSLIKTYSQKEDRIEEIEFKLNHQIGVGVDKTGAFGQVISSDNGDTKLSYQEFIEGFPVIKNDNIYKYSTEIYKPEAGVTVGGSRLNVPEIQETNTDLLQLDILSASQECIDTQFRLAYEYAMDTGKDICYDNGKTCLKDSSFKKDPQKFIKQWMKQRGVANYIQGGKSQIKDSNRWDHDIEIVSPSDMRPGDVILLDRGHAIGVKEVLEVPPGSGNKYYKQFAGSMPAISAHVYTDLTDVNSLRYDQLKGDVPVIFRWKFSGEGVEPKEVTKTVKQLPLVAGEVGGVAPKPVEAPQQPVQPEKDKVTVPPVMVEEPSPPPEVIEPAETVEPAEEQPPVLPAKEEIEPEAEPAVEPSPVQPATINPVAIVSPPLVISEGITVKTGKELFGKLSRCPSCTYWKENGEFKAASPNNIPFTLSPKQISQLSKVEKQGKLD
jgi:hypothetical protein